MPKKTDLRYEAFKKMLLEKKREMWAALRAEYFEKLGKDYHDQFDSPLDIEDMAMADLIEDTGIKVAEIRKEELTRMDEALRKLEDGTYGVCSDCAMEIDEKRLKAVPFASLCVACQSMAEKA